MYAVLFVTGFELCNSVYRMTSIKITFVVAAVVVVDGRRLFCCCIFLQAAANTILQLCNGVHFILFRSFRRHTPVFLSIISYSDANMNCMHSIE